MGVKTQRPGEPGHPGGNRRIYVRVNFTRRGVSKKPGDKPKTRLTRVFNSAKAAEAYASQVEAWLKIGDADKVFTVPAAPEPEPAAAPTFDDAVEAWREADLPALKGSTRTCYETCLRAYILPALEGKTLAEITPSEVRKWWTGVRAKGFSASHLTDIRCCLRGIFKRAVAEGLVASNPTDAILGRLGGDGPDEHAADWLTGPELTRLLEGAKMCEPARYPAILLLAATGLRVGELQGLQVGDVDLAHARLYVRRKVYKGIVETPKGGRFRVVDLPPVAVGVLGDWLRTIEAEAAVRGVAPTWLFPRRDGGPLDYWTFREALARAAKAAGIGRPVRPHRLRHSYASLAIEQGVPLLTVSRQLGHKSIRTTADIYGHLDERAGRQAAAAMECVLTGENRNPGATQPAKAT